MDGNGLDDNWRLRSDSRAHLLYSVFAVSRRAFRRRALNDYRSLGARRRRVLLQSVVY